MLSILVLCGIAIVAVANVVSGNSAVGGDEPAMMASPSTVVLAKVSVLTVHTNIPAVTVDPGSLTLNGSPALSVGVDNCGHIVGKFAIAELGLEPGQATLILCGDYIETSSFTAEDVVTVR
jgi:hypothetical protein